MNDLRKSGAQLIVDERQRQITKEGWTPGHDAQQHKPGELEKAGDCYASERPRRYNSKRVPFGWPWAPEWWKPSADRVREITKAGALYRAELDKMIATGVVHIGKQAELGFKIKECAIVIDQLLQGVDARLDVDVYRMVSE